VISKIYSRSLAQSLIEKEAVIIAKDAEIGTHKLLLNKLESELVKLKISKEEAEANFIEIEKVHKNFIDHLDLSAFDLRSNDLSASQESKIPITKPPNNIPVIDIKRVLEIKQKEENETESLESEEEEVEDEELYSENAKFLPSGSNIGSSISLTRKGSLLIRKEEVIDVLNKIYENEESKHSSDMKSSERELNSNPLNSNIDRMNEESSMMSAKMDTSVFNSNISFKGLEPNI
jgi:hypothetical protein